MCFLQVIICVQDFDSISLWLQIKPEIDNMLGNNNHTTT
jgi:hypothetical protein